MASLDFDGDVDLSLANNHDPDGTHPLYSNDLPPARGVRSIQVAPVNADGRWTRAGARVTLRRESDGYVSSRLMDTGGGYASQGVTPVHFGVPPGRGPFSVTISWFEAGERRTSTASGVEPNAFLRQWLVLRLGVG